MYLNFKFRNMEVDVAVHETIFWYQIQNDGLKNVPYITSPT